MTMSIASMAQKPRWNAQYQDYIDKYKDIAIREMHTYGIPASITLAQGLLESGAGNSELARNGNNHFGIKCRGWNGKTVYHDDDERGECFRAYDSALESYEDHSRFLATGQRYSKLFKLSHSDYKGWAHGLKSCGYATNPKYAHRLIEIIELYSLHQYDKAHQYKSKDLVGKKLLAKTKSSTNHEINYYNKNYYLIAHQGDTFESLSKETGVSKRKLRKYNEYVKGQEICSGDIIYLEKKQRKAEKKYKNKPHVANVSESMHSIAQRYGIRLKSLYRKNKLSATYQLKAGDKLRVY